MSSGTSGSRVNSPTAFKIEPYGCIRYKSFSRHTPSHVIVGFFFYLLPACYLKEASEPRALLY